MVLTDEHSLRTLGCYRQVFKDKNQHEQAHIWGQGVEVETPHIDRLAAEGALFTNFHTVFPMCTPSRASFVSGLYPHKTGAHGNHKRMRDDVVTFAEILQKQRGYYTGYGGKWHLNGDAKPGWSNTTSDYQRFGFHNLTYMWNRGHWKFLDNEDDNRQVYGFDDNWRFQGEKEKKKHYTTDYLFDRSLEFMSEAKSRNVPFAYVLSIPGIFRIVNAIKIDEKLTIFPSHMSSTDPHHPNEVRQPYQDMYKHMHFKLPRSAKKAVRRNPATPAWNNIIVSPEFLILKGFIILVCYFTYF